VKKFAQRTASVEELDVMIKKAELMKKASFCALGQSPIMPIATILKYFRDEFVKHADKNHVCPACDQSLKTYYSGKVH